MLDGVLRYATFIRKTSKEHSEFVQQMKTFCGPCKSFLEEWKVPGLTLVDGKLKVAAA